MLEGESTLFKHGKAGTIYVAIPSKMVNDSQFPFKDREVVRLTLQPVGSCIVIHKRKVK